jgi:hypothetical protein
MDSLYLGILLVFNHTGFTSHIYINNDYILNVGIMNANPQDSNSTRYTLYILDKKVIITTGMVENTRKVSPLLPYKQSWRSEEIVSLDEQIKGEFEPFAGFNCLKIEEKKSFPPLLSPNRDIRTIHHLICSKEEFAEKINYPQAIPYIPVQRKNWRENIQNMNLSLLLTWYTMTKNMVWKNTKYLNLKNWRKP